MTQQNCNVIETVQFFYLNIINLFCVMCDHGTDLALLSNSHALNQLLLECIFPSPSALLMNEEPREGDRTVI